MSDLADFLLARIAEDEAAITSRDFARPIHFVGCYYYEHTLDANLFCDCDKDGAASTRYLAECEAKRRIVKLWEIWNEPETKGPSRGHVRADAYAEGVRHAVLLSLYQLALPYADHPDWSEEWKP